MGKRKKRNENPPDETGGRFFASRPVSVFLLMDRRCESGSSGSSTTSTFLSLCYFQAHKKRTYQKILFYLVSFQFLYQCQIKLPRILCRSLLKIEEHARAGRWQSRECDVTKQQENAENSRKTLSECKSWPH